MTDVTPSLSILAASRQFRRRPPSPWLAGGALAGLLVVTALALLGVCS